MNKLFLFILMVLYSFQFFGQDPDIVGTWYMNAITADLEADEFISPFSAPQNPAITINSDYTFEGIAVCNTYSGTFEYDTQHQQFVHTVFTPSTNPCNSDLEDYIFNNFNDFYGEFTSIYFLGDQLEMEFAPGFWMQFQDTPFLHNQHCLELGI